IHGFSRPRYPDRIPDRRPAVGRDGLHAGPAARRRHHVRAWSPDFQIPGHHAAHANADRLELAAIRHRRYLRLHCRGRRGAASGPKGRQGPAGGHSARGRRMSEVLLKARGLTRTFAGEVPVMLVRDIDLEIGKGEFVAITGPSGSGKSSLLYLLGLLDQPTGGTLWLEGTDTSHFDENDLAD